MQLKTREETSQAKLAAANLETAALVSTAESLSSVRVQSVRWQAAPYAMYAAVYLVCVQETREAKIGQLAELRTKKRRLLDEVRGDSGRFQHWCPLLK